MTLHGISNSFHTYKMVDPFIEFLPEETAKKGKWNKKQKSVIMKNKAKQYEDITSESALTPKHDPFSQPNPNVNAV